MSLDLFASQSKISWHYGKLISSFRAPPKTSTMKKMPLFLLLMLITSYTLLGQTKNTRISKLLQTADSLLEKRQLQKANTCYDKAAMHASDSKNVFLQGKAALGIANCFYQKGAVDSALALSKEVAKMGHLKGNKLPALYLMGICYSAKSEFDLAIEYLSKALDLNVASQQPSETVRIRNSIANVYLKNEDTLNARLNYIAALNIAEANKDFKAQSLIYNSLGTIKAMGNHLEEALSYRKKAIKLREEHGIPLTWIPYANLANNYAQLGQHDTARYILKKAAQIAKQTKNPVAIAAVNQNFGEHYAAQKKYDLAIVYFSKSYHLADSIKHPKISLAASKALAETHRAKKDYKKALHYFENYSLAKDQQFQKTTERKLEEFQVKYEAIEKEKKIVALDKENNIKATRITYEKKQKKLLWVVFSSLVVLLTAGGLVWYWINRKRLLEKQTSLRLKSVLEVEQKERKRIAQDLHDSLGQSIALLKLQANTLQSNSAKEQEKHKKLQCQIDHAYEELRNISHNIMPNTLITLGLVPALKELIEEINLDDSLEIQFKNNDDFKGLTDDQAINLYRIVQEALVNIIKYAKASIVHIDLLKKEGTASIHIVDNGVGMNTTEIASLEGIGWKNIASRVAILSGKIKVSSPAHKGTSIAVHLKTSY